MNDDVSLIPPYLLDTDGAQPEEGGAHRTYGTLSYNRRRDCWVVRGDPGVTELCKRLFPGSESGRRGEARFPAHRRIVGDLNWLMLRYPLAVRAADRERWERALTDAREYVVRRETARRMPERVEPSPSVFTGTLTPFQQEGLAFLLRTDRALLADEMGLGKTVQALAMLAQTGAYPALVVAPPHLLRNWENEIARFVRRPDGSPLSVHVIRGLKPYALPPADIYLMHYLLLRGWKEALPECAIPTVIFDEIQELRNSGTEKYSAASLLAGAARRVVGLSGTPIYNRGAEIWNVVNILDFHFLGDYESFTREWCYGYGNQIVAKPELLGEKLREEGLMLRRTKRDVLTELPPKRRLVMPVDSDDAVYRRLMEPVRATLAQLKNDGAAAPSQRALWKMAVESGERQATGMAKAPYVAQFVRALLDARRAGAALCAPSSGDGPVQKGAQGVFAGLHHRTRNARHEGALGGALHGGAYQSVLCVAARGGRAEPAARQLRGLSASWTGRPPCTARRRTAPTAWARRTPSCAITWCPRAEAIRTCRTRWA